MSQIASSKLKIWRDDPRIFVREVFGAVPDAWQDDVLIAFPSNMRLAMVACRGPGKTCLLAWLIWNFMLTRPDPVIAVTSITADALSDTIWAELSRWQNKSPILKNAFTITNRPIPCLRFGHRSGCRVGIETTLPQWSGALRSRGVGQSRKVLCCRRRMLVERFEICFTFQSLVLVYSVLDLGFGPVFRLMPNPAATVRTRQRETPSVRATCS